MTSELDLEAIRSRAAAATPGPWEATRTYPFLVLQSGGESAISVNLATDPEPDAAFIAHAREDIPALVAEVERLRANLLRAGWIEGGRPTSAAYEALGLGAGGRGHQAEETP